MTAPRKAVFLDRDGVINEAVVRHGMPYPPATVADATVPFDVYGALQKLKRAGFLLLVVTNQPDVARGTLRREAVEGINRYLCSILPLDDFFVCYEDGESPRRKPSPGMLLEAAQKHGIDLAASFLIGDRWKDVEAGRRAGVRTVLLGRGYAEERPEAGADFTCDDIAAAAAWVLAADAAALTPAA
jgi:D-glycero-D-manno-heptose 1,7-bisphosphate phosphatase